MKAKLATGVTLLLISSVVFGATEVIHKEFTIGDRPCLVLDADPDHLIVESGDSGRIEIDIKVSPKGSYSVSTAHEPNKVTVELEPKGTWGLLLHNLRLQEIDVRVKVPEECDVVLLTRSGAVEVSGVGGEIRSRSRSTVGQVLRWVFRIGDID
ncbi:hypothetical protein JXM67_13990 [candidate division WOR-3 bacterium]|nr:hypothetical protein [candidate division WOR-3 bacterium]